MTGHGESLYLFGGCMIDHGRSNGLWQLSLKTLVWTELAPIQQQLQDPTAAPCARGGPGAVATADAVFIAFGYNGKEEQEDLWRFDLGKKSWSKIEPRGEVKPSTRSVTDLAAGANGTFFVFGGEFTPSAQGHEGAGAYLDDAFLFNEKDQTWSKLQPANAEAAKPGARGWFNTCSYEKQFVVFGGFDGNERRNDVWIARA